MACREQKHEILPVRLPPKSRDDHTTVDDSPCSSSPVRQSTQRAVPSRMADRSKGAGLARGEGLVARASLLLLWGSVVALRCQRLHTAARPWVTAG